ncbi:MULTISPECIES: type II secretion system minor pseudopilin GspJ [unclassified Agarivorans]|uniref:type II secretion system minor pseudopilin GspJ n=1 Tax=unclassified Agarivorans TaxID=2636026 RepID=UPI0026E23A1F|nr:MULTISPECIES: type II secretion system minor pseudopilin GspJ [unclassified Agarivorans]MDO6687534.1 type II secretion system minor pseudopilin GspJ [Agarivorans sp. 3_MG-2023]MDO6717133.1 type II secretion system minor pseudopilin GspJ [Agarivorans sp. 2_MG-2023]MDO6765740.1 type II secretion system minor pseudopilin GspJ [Agarivorans sp. 1_MG-2023]
MKQRGFTLLEMLVAIVIFALLTMAAYQVLQGVMRSDEISQKHGERLREVQRAMFLMQRDFTQLAPRSARDETEEQRPLIMSEKYLLESDDMGIEMMVLGWRNPQSVIRRSQLQRVAYLVKDEKLIKRFYAHPDAVVGYEPREMVILNDVEELSFRFHGSSGWSDQVSDSNQLPRAIEVKLTHKDFGELRRVFLSPEGSRAPVASQAQEDANNNTNQGDSSNSGNSGGNNSGSQPDPDAS